jgi:hypothetical protein
MNFKLITFQYLWVAPHLLLIPVAVVMFYKRLYREYPIFFSYLLFEIIQFSILYGMVSHLLKMPPWLYMKFDLYGRIGSTAFHFGILRELFESPIRHNASSRRTSARAFNWITGFLVLLATGFIAFQYYNSVGHRLVPEYAIVEALNLAQCVLLVLVILWHRYLGLRMATFPFGIAVGMGIIAAVNPFIQAWKDSIAAPNLRILDYVDMGAFHVAVLFWLACALIQNKTGRQSVSPPKTGGSSPSLGLRNMQISEAPARLRRIVNL